MVEQKPQDGYGQEVAVGQPVDNNPYPNSQQVDNNPYPNSQQVDNNPYPNNVQVDMKPDPTSKPVDSNPYPTTAADVSAERRERPPRKNCGEGMKGFCKCAPGCGGSDQRNFAIKVYGIVAFMLAITTGGVTWVFSSEPVYRWFTYNALWLFYAALLLGLVFMIIIVCGKNVFRKVPLNYIMLFTFTAVWTVMVMSFTCRFKPAEVLICAGMVFAMTLSITIMGCLLKDELFWAYGFFATCIGATIPVIVFGSMKAIRGSNSWGWFMMRAGLGYLITVLFSIYIIWDVEVIFHKLDKDEYIIGALLLYCDIVTLFLYLLACMGGSS